MAKFPDSFQNRIKRQFGGDSADFLGALERPPVTSVRKNPKKLTGLWNDNETVPWCREGYYLSQKPVFTLDPLFHAGCYYPQEAGSMVIDWILRQIESIPDSPIVLDLCAAPGGKATLLASWMEGKGLLVVNEIIRNRSLILLENMIKWGYPNCVVTQNSPADFSGLQHFFDLIIVDAPCSGEGMFRKEKRAIEEWSESAVAMCAVRQRKILDDIWYCLKPGGILIYSTCTYNPSENEDNIANFAKENDAEVLQLVPPELWGITTIEIAGGSGLAFYPHLTKGEGFFVTAVRKTEGKEHKSFSKKEKNTNPIKLKTDFSSILTTDVEWGFFKENQEVHAFSQRYFKHLNLLKNSLNMLDYGVNIGISGQNGLIPSQSLAMSMVFRNNGLFSEIALELKEALDYLKGDIFPSSTIKKGYVLFKYKEIPLGFGKDIGLRINNLYPSNWRIRMKV